MKKLSTKTKLKIWKTRLKLRKKRLDRNRNIRSRHREIIKKANQKIKKIKSSLNLISDNGLEFVAKWEGFFSKPYNDPSPGRHCTVGYGHLIHFGPCTPDDLDDVWIIGQKKPGQLTKDEAKELLKSELNKYAKDVKNATSNWDTLNQRQKDALVSFAYNCGVNAYKESTLRKYVINNQLLKAADEFPRWVYADGKKLPGLVNRRREERKMFLS